MSCLPDRSPPGNPTRTGAGDDHMSDLPTSARAVVIGAGIVGNSICYHLSQLGWRDLVLLDKGHFPNPGGSTGHASNFISPVDHSKAMTALTLDSMRQYQDLDVFTESGGTEGARTEERMQELPRGGHAGAAPAHVVGARLGCRQRLDGDAGRDQADGAVHRRDDPAGRIF